GDGPDEKLKAALCDRVVELQKMQAELSPEHFLAPGYGVPLVGEFDSIPQDKINDVNDRTKEYGEEMQSIIKEYFPEELQELQTIAVNRGNILKSIAAATAK
ncbi:MAG: hypothetical protein H7336_08745, partial [Bacteriovorax sp.]|nr:hypothetical protein [Bacteriovorax sp.]